MKIECLEKRECLSGSPMCESFIVEGWQDANEILPNPMDDASDWVASAANLLAWGEWGAFGRTDGDSIFQFLEGKEVGDVPEAMVDWWMGEYFGEVELDKFTLDNPTLSDIHVALQNGYGLSAKLNGGWVNVWGVSWNDGGYEGIWTTQFNDGIKGLNYLFDLENGVQVDQIFGIKENVGVVAAHGSIHGTINIPAWITLDLNKNGFGDGDEPQIHIANENLINGVADFRFDNLQPGSYNILVVPDYSTPAKYVKDVGTQLEYIVKCGEETSATLIYHNLDRDGDGRVTSFELDAVRANWGTDSRDGDLNGDGRVDSKDLDLVRAHYVFWMPIFN